MDKPVRIEFPSQGGQEFSGFFKTGTDASTLIATCDSDADNLTAVDGINGSGQLTAGQECFIDDGSSIIIWTTHFTKFGVTRGTSTTTTSGTTAGSAGGTGASAGASSSGGPGGFGGILGTPLTINEVSYDKCAENIARILISSDAETLPSVIIHAVFPNMTSLSN